MSQPWLPVVPSIISDEAVRSGELLDLVIEQFDLDSSPTRYAPHYTDGKLVTYCNIFAWDATKAMGCEIPHWFNDAGEAAPTYKGKEMTANEMLVWLHTFGPARGWSHAADLATAKLYASQGRVALAVWQNTAGPGHVAVFRSNGNIAQAGARCFSDESLDHGFGNKQPQFFIHP